MTLNWVQRDQHAQAMVHNPYDHRYTQFHQVLDKLQGYHSLHNHLIIYFSSYITVNFQHD